MADETTAQPQREQPDSSTPAPNAPSSAPRAPQPPPPTAQATYQPVQPYAQYSYPQPVYNTMDNLMPFDKTWHWCKLVLMGASIVFAVLLIALSVSVANQSSNDDFYGMSLTAFWCVPIGVVVILWDLAEIITLFACGHRRGAQYRRGIHPGAHVGVDLVLWLATAFCTFLSVMAYISAQDIIRYCQEENSNNESDGSLSYYYDDDECDSDNLAALSGRYLGMICAVVVFMGLLTLVHFIIFVRACQETNQFNRARANLLMVGPPPVYYIPPPGMVPYPNAYPMMPPQAHVGAAPGDAAGNEKGRAAPPTVDNYSNLAGFYAPSAQAPNPSAPHPPLLPPTPAANGSSSAA
ncbi:hypothetical protein BX600DRAFT_151979 [Xylariales sp. PMI_506]|nr:hypothetical protein BX600DRAFT_151979 [Xylariales sp. PMI_506]